MVRFFSVKDANDGKTDKNVQLKLIHIYKKCI